MNCLELLRFTLHRPFIRGGPLAMVCWAISAPSASSQDFFAEPGSGRRVSNYAVELTVARDTRQRFEIPTECDKVRREYERGAAQWGGLVDRYTWPKVVADCEFHQLVHERGASPTKNYLGGYDFHNAPLFDLPFARPCIPGNPACSGLPAEAVQLARTLGLGREGEVLDDLSGETCKLGDGVFRGRVRWKDGQPRCEGDPSGPGFRIISVHYADVDNDGILDAVLRMVPLGPGLPRRPLLLAVTRLAPDQPLTVVRPKVKQ